MQPPVTINRLPYFHVVRRATDWSVHREGEADRGQVLTTRERALEVARLLAERYSCIVVEHDGKLRQRHDFRPASGAPAPVLARGTTSYPSEPEHRVLARGTGDYPVVTAADEPDPGSIH